jgi:hypothetical protein
MALLSPGVQVTVTDKSQYVGTQAPTVPLFFVATKYGKMRPNSNLVATGTIEAGVPRLITSLRESLQSYGVPIFHRDAYDQPNHGDCRNEYGLLALNQYLSLGNRAYVIRANIDLDDSQENLQYLWQQATAKVVDKAKSLFANYLSAKQESNGLAIDLMSGQMGGFPTKPSNWDPVYETDTAGSIKKDANGKPVVKTAGLAYKDKVTWYENANKTFSENKILEDILKWSVNEIVGVTSTFADRYGDFAYLRYNLKNILVGNYFDVEIPKTEQLTDDVTGSTVGYRMYAYSDCVDPQSELAQHNLLASTMARKVRTEYSFVNEPKTGGDLGLLTQSYDADIDPDKMFMGLIGSLHQLLHSDTIGGTFKIDASANFTADNITQVTNAANKLTGKLSADSGVITCEVLNIAQVSNYSDTNKKWVVGAKCTIVYGFDSGATTGTATHSDITTAKFEYDETDKTLKYLSPIKFTNIAANSTAYKFDQGVVDAVVISGSAFKIDASQTFIANSITLTGATTPLAGTVANGIVACNVTKLSKSTAYKTTNKVWDVVATCTISGDFTSTATGATSKLISGTTTATTFTYDESKNTLSYNAALSFDNIVVDTATYTFTQGKAGDAITTVKTLALANSVDIKVTSGGGTYKDGLNRNQFAKMVKDVMDNYAKTYSLYYSTHPFPKGVGSESQTSISRLVNTGKDAMRRMEIVKKLAQIIKSNTTTNLDLNPDFANTSDITSDGYEFNVILCPGFPELADEMLELSARVKQEAFVIADSPMNKSPRDVIRWGALQDENTVQAAYNIIRSDNRGLIAYYYPHGLVTNLDGFEVFCAASGLALAAFANNDNVAYPWYAPAGPNRGVLTNSLSIKQVGFVEGDIGTSNVRFNRVRLNDVMKDALYSDCNINPINDSLQYGIMVMGQKTRVTVGYDSALGRINVARMVMYARRGLRKLLSRYLMEPNTDKTRKNVSAAVSSFLDNIKTKQGVYDYAILCDETNNTPDTIDRNELMLAIALKPTKTIEFVYCDITLVRTGDNIKF